ncbi:MAG: class I SAM-dependent methyltransferase [Chitinophagales bacterium]
MLEVKEYYNSLAATYDNERFDNSYGKFIDTEERKILADWLKGIDKSGILDYGCGTGRLTDFANAGIDISEQMLEVARQKHPAKKFSLLHDHSIENNSLNAVYSFHVIMHLQQKDFDEVIDFIHSKLANNGIFIFDVLSSFRKSKKEGWHANTSYSIDEIKNQIECKFEVITYTGILFLPIHRIPASLRKYFLWLDQFLCNGFLKKYSSYYCIYAKKK